MERSAETPAAGEVPFDAARLDRLMEEAGIDVLVVTSKHNARYLMGGYTFFFFATMAAIGHSRYLPVVIYPKGAPDRAAYIGNAMEDWEHAMRPFWTPTVRTSTWGTSDAAALAVEHIAAIGRSGAAVGIEPGFLPADAHAALTEGLSGAHFSDATGVLERLRAVKSPDELALLRRASEAISDAMVATIGWAGEGTTKADIIEKLRREETDRGLEFEYRLLTLGTGTNRASSDDAWRPGEILSIDSGGNCQGYIGDLCRMGVLGEPDAELEDLLGEVEAVQQAAFARVRAGTPGGEVVERAQSVLRPRPVARYTGGAGQPRGAVPREQPAL
jgi:Xaa-Pro aminopeptidase